MSDFRLSSRARERLIRDVQSVYPGWTGFQDERFLEEEVTYKREAAERAQATLSESELSSLIESGDTAEIIQRIREVARLTNLLYQGVPSQGDLAVLYVEGLDEAAFCRAFADLLWGEGDSADRLDRYCLWMDSVGHRANWTFATYFLFLTQPDTEIFVKPKTTARFLKTLEVTLSLRSRPSGDAYREFRAICRRLLEDLADFGPRDMIDIQGLIWVCGSRAAVKYWKIAPGELGSQWDLCREGGFIAVGWDALGDISDLSKAAFDDRAKQLIEQDPELKKNRLDQVWKLARLSPGDRVIANRGTTEILGVGTVTGEYFFVPGEQYGHRVPVEWTDTTPKRVDEYGWRRTMIRLDRPKFEELVGAPSAPGPSGGETGGFPTAEAFELLAALHENPTKDTYNARKEEIQRELEQPFQALLRSVAERLPDFMKAELETHQRIFAKILKNDWGRGGAWDFYWGAFYPEGSRRIQDAQLFVGIHRDLMEYGFAVGEQGAIPRNRLAKNLRAQGSWLKALLPTDLRYGTPPNSSGPSPSLGFDEWALDPASHGFRVTRIIGRESALRISPGQLERDIAALFQQLFPLVIATIYEDPVPYLRRLTEDDEEEAAPNPEYSLTEMAEETGFDEKSLERWVRAVERKGQAIFYGPPGTGKTYVAERLARHLVGGGDGFSRTLQFHPAYAYEDFIQGIRPHATPDGQLTYEVASGRFLDFCQEAASRKGKSVLIIDEINRANLSRVFGELMYLLEYRDRRVPLAGGGFLSIPKQVRIIGTMNTADRSIALVDHALRRRFAFIPLQPDFDVLSRFHARTETGFPVGELVRVLKEINTAIDDPHYEVGTSFFMREDLRDEIEDIWRMEILPYLEEYFFDQPHKVLSFRWEQVASRLQP